MLNKILTMKKLKEIKLMIQIAQQGWSEIEGEIQRDHSPSLSTKKELLNNLLEDIRKNIEHLLFNFKCSMLVKVCRKFLENTFLISEKLGSSYGFAGYNESYYILDTIKIAEGFSKKS